MRLRALIVVVAVVACLTGCSQGHASDAAANAPRAQPSDSSSSFVVERADFAVTYRLEGATANSLAVGVDPPIGNRFVAKKRLGATVRAGERIGSFRPQSEQTDPGTVGRSRELAAQAAAGPVRAAVAGKLDTSPEIRIHNEGIDVVVALKPLQELRYRGLQFRGEATVETVLGQRVVPCLALWIEPINDAGQGGADGDESSIPQAALRCRLRPSVETAPGLRSQLKLTSLPMSEAVAIPVAAVGITDDGRDYVAQVDQQGVIVARPVVVGATDGVRRVILGGLEPGDQVVLP